jgi:hypothetical protein
MPELVVPGPVSEERCIREAVCVHTRKIFDSCRDKDCIEDLRVYPTRSSQEVLDRALSVRAGCAELLHAYIDVEPVTFNRGFYTVDVRYYYRITADAFVGAPRPVEVTGLAVFDKRVILFGSEGNAKVFSSQSSGCAGDFQRLPQSSVPEAVVEAVDPLILGMKLVDVCDCRSNECGCTEIPVAVAACFQENLTMGGENHRLYVTLGQFSLIRLERDTQLLMPVYDYCMPEKECPCGSCTPCQEDPCELFRKVQFPVNEFFPPNCIPNRGNSYQDIRSGSC